MKKNRLYKEDAKQADIFQFELGNELGAHLEKKIIKNKESEKKKIKKDESK